MSEEKPSESHKRRGDFHKHQHAPKHNHEVHEIKRLIICGDCNDMVCIHLIILHRICLPDEVGKEEIDEEVATCVEQAPYMDVSHCAHAFVIIESGLAIATDEKHGDDGEHDGYDGVYRG